MPSAIDCQNFFTLLFHFLPWNRPVCSSSNRRFRAFTVDFLNARSSPLSEAKNQISQKPKQKLNLSSAGSKLQLVLLIYSSGPFSIIKSCFPQEEHHNILPEFEEYSSLYNVHCTKSEESFSFGG